MYQRPVFIQDDPAAILALIRSNPFAQLVTAGPRGIEAAHLPLTCHAEGDTWWLSGHFAAGNPQADLVGGQTEAMAVFSGPHAYISPAWYEAQPAVPTWDFAAVHVYARLDPVTDPAHITADVQAMAEADPAHFDVLALPADYRTRMFAGIRAFRMRPARVETQWKMSQNRSVADRRRVIASLRAQADPSSAQVADLVAATLPPTLVDQQA